MKKIILTFALLLLLPVAGAHADPLVVVGQKVWMGQYDAFGYPNGGGPFVVHDASTDNALFLTFCIENTEYFSPGTQYTVERIDTVAIRGVRNGQVGDTLPLAYTTAFLYHQFMNSWDGTKESAIDYQLAIWKAQGQIDDPGTGLALYNAALHAVDDPAIWGQTIGNVRVLGFDTVERWNEFENKIVATDRVQDMLVLVPEPASMLLLGTGLAGLIAARRRRR